MKHILNAYNPNHDVRKDKSEVSYLQPNDRISLLGFKEDMIFTSIIKL